MTYQEVNQLFVSVNNFKYLLLFYKAKFSPFNFVLYTSDLLYELIYYSF